MWRKIAVVLVALTVIIASEGFYAGRQAASDENRPGNRRETVAFCRLLDHFTNLVMVDALHSSMDIENDLNSINVAGFKERFRLRNAKHFLLKTVRAKKIYKQGIGSEEDYLVEATLAIHYLGGIIKCSNIITQKSAEGLSDMCGIQMETLKESMIESGDWGRIKCE